MSNQEIIELVQDENCSIINQNNLWGIWDNDIQEWAVFPYHHSKKAALNEFNQTYNEIQQQNNKYFWSNIY